MKKNLDAVEKTLHYWKNIKGANCARATSCGLLFANGKNELVNPMYKAMLAMGGGMGELDVCGAVTGTLSALGIILSEKFKGKENSEKLIMDEIKEWKNNFRNKFGTLICRTLLDDFKDKEGKIDFKHPERRIHCTDIVESAVIFAQQIIEKT